MPCDSSYMEPNGKEKELQRTAYLLTFVYSQLEQEIPVYMVDTAKNQYARADFVADLCAKIQSLGEEDFERIVYNGRSKISRNLADWWERHEEAAIEEAWLIMFETGDYGVEIEEVEEDD